MAITAPSSLEIYCLWIAASQLKATSVWPPWNTSSWNSHIHSPEVCVPRRAELYVVTSRSQSQALSVGHKPPAANCTKGLWKHTGVESRKNGSLQYLQLSSGLLLCPQCALKGPVSFSINSVSVPGDLLSNIHKVHKTGYGLFPWKLQREFH